MTDNDDRQKIYTEADNVTIMIGTDINEAIKEFFESLLKKYRESIQTMKLSHYVFDSVDKLCCKLW